MNSDIRDAKLLLTFTDGATKVFELKNCTVNMNLIRMQEDKNRKSAGENVDITPSTWAIQIGGLTDIAEAISAKDYTAALIALMAQCQK